MAAPYHLRARHPRIVRRRSHQSERDARTSAYLRSADAAVARYRDAFQVDCDDRDPRLTDGLREMEAARTEFEAIGAPRGVLGILADWAWI